MQSNKMNRYIANIILKFNKRLFFLIFLFFSIATNTIAQSSEIGTWNILNIKYNHSKDLSMFAEGQIRSLQFYDNFHYHELKFGANYSVHKNVKLTLGAGSYQTYNEVGNFRRPKNNDEFRLWPQVVFFQDISGLKVEQRYRMEMRWTSNGYRNRFRYRLGFSYPFGKEVNGYKPFQISVNNELFFTDKEPFFERNRAQVALNFKSSKHTTLQLGYLHQFDYRINDEIGRDFLVVGYYYEIFRKSSTKSSNGEYELKDN